MHYALRDDKNCKMDMISKGKFFCAVKKQLHDRSFNKIRINLFGDFFFFFYKTRFKIWYFKRFLCKVNKMSKLSYIYKLVYMYYTYIHFVNNFL